MPSLPRGPPLEQVPAGRKWGRHSRGQHVDFEMIARLGGPESAHGASSHLCSLGLLPAGKQPHRGVGATGGGGRGDSLYPGLFAAFGSLSSS